MPIPTRAPTRPPTVPPTPARARAATIGPAAIKGPIPGIAIAPIPASQPNAPPTRAPVPGLLWPLLVLLYFSRAQNPWFRCFGEITQRYPYYGSLLPSRRRRLARHCLDRDKFQTQLYSYLP